MGHGQNVMGECMPLTMRNDMSHYCYCRTANHILDPLACTVAHLNILAEVNNYPHMQYSLEILHLLKVIVCVSRLAV